MKTSLIKLFIPLFFPFLAACVTEDEPGDSGIRQGEHLPEFSVDLSDGRVVTTSSLLGKVSVIEFFNTSCADCREFCPVFQEIYDEFAADSGVMIFSIAREEEKTSIEAYWKANGITVPFSPQPDRRVYNLFATTGIPRVYISGPDGIVRYIFTDADHPSAPQIISLIHSLLPSKI